MITGASWNPFAAVRSPVVPLNENVSPGAIRVPSISFGDELHVVEPPGRAAVGRRVGRDDAVDAHRLRDLRRPLRIRDPDDEVRRPLVGRERGRRDRLRRRRDVELEPRSRRADHDLPRRGRPGSARPAACARPSAESRSRYSSAPRPEIETVGAAAGGQREQRRDPPARHPPARLPVGRAGSAPRARCAPASPRRRGRRSSPWARWSRAAARRPCRGRTSASAATTVAAAALRSSCRPVMPSTTRMSSPSRTTLASTPLRSTPICDLGELVADGSVVGRRPAARRRRRRSAPAGA